MRLGTKILLLTLGLVVGLTVVVVAVVRERIKSQELVRTPAAIHRAVADYFERVAAAGENTERVARLLFEDPSARAELKNLNDSGGKGVAGPAAVQFRDYLFAQVMQRELAVPLVSGERIAPAFHVLLTERAETLLLVAPGNPALEGEIRSASPAWLVDQVVEDAGRRVTQYVLVGETLLLVIGVPVSTSAGRDEPPTNAYFVGYIVDDRWAGGFFTDMGEERQGFFLGAWFVSDGGDVLAKGGRGSLVAEQGRFARELLRAAADAKPGADPLSTRLDDSFETYLAEVTAYETAPGQRLILAGTASLDQALTPMYRLLQTITMVGVAAIVVALVACRWIASRISRPVRLLVSEADRIGRGEFDVRLDTSRKDELGDLARGFTHMAAGLAQRDFIKDTFGRFVDPSVVAGLIEDPQSLRPGGEERIQTVLMSDIEGFTTIAEKLSPEQIVSLLNAHLGASADIVAAEKGVVDKFIGDAVVAFWGPPLTKDHADRACRAALAMIKASRSIDERCERLGVPPLRVRIGVATGPMLVGNIGSPSKFNYTVMGDVVNLCSRMEGLNKLYGTSVLATEPTVEALGSVWIVRQLDTVRVAGRGAAVRVFEVMAAPTAEGDAPQRRDAYAAARGLYVLRRWAEARNAFDALADRFPHDRAARAMALRCARFEAIPPDEDWDGVWVLDSK